MQVSSLGGDRLRTVVRNLECEPSIMSLGIVKYIIKDNFRYTILRTATESKLLTYYVRIPGRSCSSQILPPHSEQRPLVYTIVKQGVKIMT